MKTRLWRIALVFSLGAAFCMGLPVMGEEPSTPEPESGSAPAPAPPPENPAPPLSYGAEDVLRLSRAQVGDEVTLNYIQSSQTSYNLSPNEITYLKSEGVSDQVIKAMIDSREPAASDAPARAASQASREASSSESPSESSVTAIPLYAPIYVGPVPAAIPSAAPPASTLYVIPYPSAGTTVQCYQAPRVYGRGSTVITINRGYGGSRAYSIGGSRGSFSHRRR